MIEFDVSFKILNQEFSVGFEKSAPKFDVDVGEVMVIEQSSPENAEKYEGSYDIEPLPESQSLPTAKRYCTDNIQVRAIPFYEVSNTSGGTTVIIDKLE